MCSAVKLPNASKALVERRKLTDYLLDFDHPEGAGKAEFFSRFGLTAPKWQVLAKALRTHARSHDVSSTSTTEEPQRCIFRRAPDPRSGGLSMAVEPVFGHFADDHPAMDQGKDQQTNAGEVLHSQQRFLAKPSMPKGYEPA